MAAAEFDVFISHATEDKPYVEPLVKALKDAEIRVWFDRTTLEWGDDLRSSIDLGLNNCRYGIVVFSKAFLRKKKWTEYELNGLFARELAGQKLILPIWHGITREDVLLYGPAFADRVAKNSSDSYADIVACLLGLLGRATTNKESNRDAVDLIPESEAIEYEILKHILCNGDIKRPGLRPILPWLPNPPSTDDVQDTYMRLSRDGYLRLIAEDNHDGIKKGEEYLEGSTRASAFFNWPFTGETTLRGRDYWKSLKRKKEATSA